MLFREEHHFSIIFSDLPFHMMEKCLKKKEKCHLFFSCFQSSIKHEKWDC